MISTFSSVVLLGLSLKNKKKKDLILSNRSVIGRGGTTSKDSLGRPLLKGHTWGGKGGPICP